MLYSYRAKSAEGKIVEGTLDAADKFALARELRKRQQTLIDASQSEALPRSRSFLTRLSDRFARVAYKDKMQFFANLATMLDSGLTLSRALTVLSRQTRNVKMQQHLADMIQAISRGDAFAQTLESQKGLFSREAIELSRAGEASGSLPKVLRRIADSMQRRYDIVRKVRGAMVYPAIVVFLMIGIGFFMLIVVVPPLTETFEAFEVELPLLTRILISLGHIVSGHIILSFMAVGACIAAVVKFFKSKIGRRLFEMVILRIPALKVPVREYYAGSSLRTLSALLSAGVDITLALDITKEAVSHSYYRQALDEASERVQKGAAIHTVFLEHEDLFPAFVSEMAEVGGETGKLADMLDEVAEVYEDHVATLTKNISSIVEPLLMVVVGLFVGLFAVAVINPLYSLTNSLG